jgi:hypothetical protein
MNRSRLLIPEIDNQFNTLGGIEHGADGSFGILHVEAGFRA